MTTVERALAAALYAESDTDLDTGASLLAADPSADAELALRGQELVGRAWERGWQPADVVRMVRRELAEPHVRLAVELVLVQLKRYERLPARWAEQADALADAVRGAGERSEDRFTRATTVLELYRLLLRLPAIEPVGPVPGTPVHLPPVHGEPKTLTRIRALLAKAEATEFPQEAEALSAKAQELMALHSIDEAVLAAGGQRGDAPGACRIGVDAPYETAKAILLDAVASANHCRAVWNGEFGFSTVVGFEADLEAVELLYTSLLVQGTAAMTRAEALQRAGGRKRTKTFRQSFLLAYANRLGDLLSATAREVESTASPDLLPVLATRAVAVAGRAEEMFPRTVRTRVRGATDAAGWESGTTAANRAHHGPARRRLPG
ncbi:DUF2786 domain-containing protein [Streptomyces sp. TLI_146]|uniref:DUF2786 domain-containing protein n=1 Tax=Streptomyces sp. TLI_146 TaxID=1938858 RepID=UPI000C705AE8|nr:DUF2786 domain-containing protein [Streptomyces sp. TLI_146]PKV87027.1 uncharacterized protein DUF2786 [Streptomyces sp. TLI_146]